MENLWRISNAESFGRMARSRGLGCEPNPFVTPVAIPVALPAVFMSSRSASWRRSGSNRLKNNSRLVLDTIPVLITSSRPDGYHDFLNQRWLNYVGRSLEDLRGWGWTGTIHPVDVEGTVDKWRATLASVEPFSHEARMRRADGVYRWMLLCAVPLGDRHGNIVKWYGANIDIEDRKRTEEALRSSEREQRDINTVF
jgi:PAS domain S-box-containing protein